MSEKKPPAVFEIVFKGGNVYPHKIPFAALSATLQAVQSLAAGEEDESKEIDTGKSLGLLGVKRGSAVLQFFADSPSDVITNIRGAGELINNSQRIDDYVYALSAVEKLSAIARGRDCKLILRSATNHRDILARIEPDTYQSLSGRLLVSGETTVIGRVVRVGGATRTRCAIRLPNQDKLIFCSVSSRDLAKKLGRLLYQDVELTGEAQWLRTNWHIRSFSITSFKPPKRESLSDAMDAIWSAGGDAWDSISEPEAFLEKVTGS